MTFSHKFKWVAGFILLAIVVMPIGQTWAQNETPSRYSTIPSGLGPNLFFFDLEDNLSSATYMTIAHTHEGVTQNAEARVTGFVEIIDSETSFHQWPKIYTRIEFLSPEDIAGDVFIIEQFRGEEKTFFWNSELLTPLEINTRFEVFGNITLLILIGDVFDDYVSAVGNMARYIEADVPQPETLDEKLFIGRQVRVIENFLEVDRESAERVVFPKMRLLSYNYVLPYQIHLMDENENVLKELHYEDWRNTVQIENPEGQIGIFMKDILVIDHVIPGDTTRLTIDRVEFETVELSEFDPDLLGQ
jgi:hypothetical protein